MTSVQEPDPRSDLVERLMAINRGYRRARLAEHEHELGFVKGAKVTAVQADILETLLRYKLLTMSDLSTAAGIDPAVASRAVVGLNALNLVQRGANVQDRRVVTVSATSQGRQVARQIADGRRQSAQQRLSQVPASERALLVEMLEKYWAQWFGTGSD